MHLIFLNCYSGQLKTPLFDFIQQEKVNTDIFCFSEVSKSLQTQFTETLPDFSSVFKIGGLLTDCNELSGQSVFVRKDIEILESEKIDIHDLKTDDIGFLLKANLKLNGKSLSLGDVHGTSKPGDKEDSDIRIKQSKVIINSFKNEEPEIICGDFNLLPETKSVKTFEDNGYRNLIKDFKIGNTRNRIAWEQLKNEPGFVKQYFADYCFVSPEIKVKSFEVPSIEVSDHLPLILDFEI